MRPHKLSRRDFFRVLGVGGAGLAAVLYVGQWLQTQTEAPERELPSDQLASKIIPVIPRDAKRAIMKPVFIGATDADLLFQPEDIVLGLELQRTGYAYPRNIMNYHEIVNQDIDRNRIAVTYCPLTGSPIAFRPPPAGPQYTFGVSGRLLHSNLVMYDHQTNSSWPQLLGKAISGPQTGTRLEEIPMDVTTWAKWRDLHPDSLVLSPDTGHNLPYDIDIYQGYNRSADVLYAAVPPLHHPKKIVIGLKNELDQIAILKDELKPKTLINPQLGNQPVVVVYDEESDIVRVFSRVTKSVTRWFSAVGQSKLMDNLGGVWNARGVGIGEKTRGEELSRLASVEAYWFAWYALFPKTKII